VLQWISLSRHPAHETSKEDPPRGTVAPILMMQRPPDSPGPSLSQTADRRGMYATSRRETRDLAAARLTSMPRIEREGSAAAEISEKSAVTSPLSHKKTGSIF